MSAKQLKLKPVERRAAAREVPPRRPKGRLRLHADYQDFDVVEIRDVSPFGLGLRLDVVIDDDAPVRIEYVDENLRITLSGTVVWKKPVRLPEPNRFAAYGCWVGIFLHPHDLDANFALYRALMDGTS